MWQTLVDAWSKPHIMRSPTDDIIIDLTVLVILAVLFLSAAVCMTIMERWEQARARKRAGGDK